MAREGSPRAGGLSRLSARLNLPLWRLRFPGLLTALTIAFAATFLSEHYGGPQLLYALFFGMAFNFIPADSPMGAGLNYAGREVLRIGVALLGARITLEQIGALGVAPVALVAFAVVTTIGFGTWLSARLGRSRAEGVLTGGAVAICGASAALAISAALPKTADSHRLTLLTVVGVTTLSTLAMVLYPALAQFTGMDPATAGIFIGGSIHDVAQVVGAGYILSAQAGDTATVVKLFRVAMLVPVVLVVAFAFRKEHGPAEAGRPPLLPGFLVLFLAFVAANSLGAFNRETTEALGKLSRWCLVTAIAALGVKTSFKQLAELGWQPVALLVGETLFIGAVVLAGLAAIRQAA